MSKFDARWGCGLVLGCEVQERRVDRGGWREQGGEVWLDGQAHPGGATVSDTNHLEWITVVPWNRRGGDKEVDGDLLEFDVKKGLDRQLAGGGEAGHHEGRGTADHLTERTFGAQISDKHVYTDRCPRCSAILGGLHVQPHTEGCRIRMETALSSDIRVKRMRRPG